MKILLTIAKLLLVMLLSFTLFHDGKATHAMGAELTFTCNGGSNYTFTLHFYRDCSGVSAPGSFTMNYTGCASGSYTLSLVSSQEVTPLCPSQLPNSTCNGGTLPGVEEYIYTYTGNIAACANWRFSIREANRNGSITTMVNPGNEELYVETWLDNQNVTCNNSPIFTNKPIPFICVGQPYTYNHGATDPDGDSLSYQLIDALSNAGTPVAYSGTFSGNNPMTSAPPAAIDPVSGNITITPTAVQIAVITVLVTEWRNGVAIGSVMRDIQVTVINCPGNGPAVSGIDSTPVFIDTLCMSEVADFYVYGYDMDWGDSVTMSWNNGIPGGSFTITPGNPGVAPVPPGLKTLFSENWGPGNFGSWTTTGGNWVVGANYTPTGAAAPTAYFFKNPPTANYDQQLTSPVIDATGESQVLLDYVLQMDPKNQTGAEFLEVQYKTTSSGTWTTLETFNNGTALTNITRTNQSLTGMAGNMFQIRFRAYGVDSKDVNGWGIDNIVVKGDSTSGNPGSPGTHPVGHFNWVLTPGDLGNHFFTVTVTDNSCPLSQSQTVAFQLFIYNCLLPVSGIELTGTAETSGIRLNWRAELEENLKDYILERSTDGLSFHEIHSLRAQGSGSEYEYFDQDAPVEDKIWYRLRMQDLNGMEQQSDIIEVVPEAAKEVMIYPNPFRNEFTVSSAVEGKWLITDLSGRTLSTGAIGAGKNIIRLDDQPAGLYLLMIRTSSGTRSFRISKQ